MMRLLPIVASFAFAMAVGGSALAESPYVAQWIISGAGGELAASPDGSVFVARSGSYLSAYGPDGQLLWSHSSPAGTTVQAYQPTMGDEVLYALTSSSGTNTLSQYDAGSGTWLWGQAQASSSVRLALAPSGGVEVVQRWGSGGNLWIARYNSAGSLLWSNQTSTSFGFADAAVDASGNGYLSGSGQPFAASLLKYAAGGQVLWERDLSVIDHYTSGGPVALDSLGNACLAGQTGGSLFGPAYDVYQLFVAKYDPDGNLLWGRQYPSSGWINTSVAIGPDGSVYVAGRPDVYPSLGSLLVKYDAAGNLLWARNRKDVLGGIGSIAVDGLGNVFVSDAGRLLKYAPGGHPGDVNLDNIVNLVDLGILATNYGTTSSAGLATGDLNDDGAVNVVDLGILATNYDWAAANDGTVPEPASLALLATGLLGLLRRRAAVRLPTAN